jgi:3-phenylpropionate/cinnamic acid dioxygenase small subunit
MLAAADTREIENLIARYAELVDTGDFAGLGELFAEGVFIGGGARFPGREAVRQMFLDRVIVYEDGTPRTHHVTTNLIVEAGKPEGSATARCYVTVFQAVPGLLLQPIAAGRYQDRFERHDGRWRFVERRFDISLTGDLSRHLHLSA